MAIDLSTPETEHLDEVMTALRNWQREDAPIQLHPGDVGWFWRFGADATAAALRTWRRGGELLAIGFLDGPDVLRVTVAPEVWDEDALARQVLADVADPDRGVLPAGAASVEAPPGSRVQGALDEAGWRAGEPWTPLRRDLAEPVEVPDLQVDVVRPGHVSEFTAVHRSAWDSPRFTDDVWRTMASGAPFADAQCLLGRDEHGAAVAGVTVWSAGPGRPALLEPLGVHTEHRGRGYGPKVCVAAAAEMQQLGASSVWVCTLSSLTGAVATYRSAGFAPSPERLDRTRTA